MGIISTTIQSPLGQIQIAGTELGVRSVSFRTQYQDAVALEALPDCIKTCARQLEEYFAGQRTAFDFPVDLDGTDFEKRVWNALTEIPHGKTWSYLDLAKRLGDEKLTRAVGMANGKNPIAIAIPCHRVIGSDGSLTGYAGGMANKKWLLEHEGAIAQTDLFH